MNRYRGPDRGPESGPDRDHSNYEPHHRVAESYRHRNEPWQIGHDDSVRRDADPYDRHDRDRHDRHYSSDRNGPMQRVRNFVDRFRSRPEERSRELDERAWRLHEHDRPHSMRADSYGRQYDAYEHDSGRDPRGMSRPSTEDLARSRYAADDRYRREQEEARLGRYESRWGNRGGFGEESGMDRQMWERGPRDANRNDMPREGRDQYDDRGHIYREGSRTMRDRLTRGEGYEDRDPRYRRR